MMPIFHDRKKSWVGDKKNLETEQNDCFRHIFSFSVNKKKKNYKVKFSTNLILKKNQQR